MNNSDRQDSSNRQASDQPHDAEVRAALNRIVASPVLNKSPQLASFLRFVVEQKLAGNGDRIKAYTIAADTFGRDASFDPQHDPIVRVEAVRLRRALARYYVNGGHDDPVVIDLPRGNYVPEFRANTPRHSAMARLSAKGRLAIDTARRNLSLVPLIIVVSLVVIASYKAIGMLLALLF